MCGIAGIWSDRGEDNLEFEVAAMNRVLVHRGPDGQGIWHSITGNVCLGHTRLSIIDLSDHGKQPMTLLDRYAMTYNGEVYNYIELRAELAKKGYIFKTETDTEVLLTAYHEYGPACLEKLDGMFAFVIYDELNNELFGARDRFGEKPLFYHTGKDRLVFASEMKALWRAGVEAIRTEKMLYNYLALDLVENPFDQSETFFSGIKKIKPAHYFFYRNNTLTEYPYWKIDIEQSLHLDQHELTLQWRNLMCQSVKRRLRADVQIGVSLSGGIDSSSIVALIQKLGSNTRTYSARFQDFSNDEGSYIELVCKSFGTQHTNVFVNETNLLRDLEKLLYFQEEPFQTGSIYAQYCVYEAARSEGTLVMLDGQGADEYLCGYEKDFSWYLKELLFDRVASKRFVQAIKQNHDLDISFSSRDVLSRLMPGLVRSVAALKRSLVPYPEPGIGRDFNRTYGRAASPFAIFSGLKEALRYQLSQQGLEKLLRFADRNSMAHSVEVRLPYLCHEMVAFAMSLHVRYLLSGGWSKAILRNAMQGWLPDEIVWRRRKIGFEVPQEQWMKHPAAGELYHTSKEALIARGYVTPQYLDSWKVINAAMFLGDI